MGKSYWRNKIVAVTGGGGFIGSHFVEELALSGAQVRCLHLHDNDNIEYLKKINGNIDFIQVDLLNRHDLLVACHGIDTIINCAAKDGNAEYKTKNAATILDANINIVSNVLHCSVANKIKNSILLSSAEVYPQKASSPIMEEDDYISHFDNTSNGYVLSKRFTELFGRIYKKQHGINVYLPRPTNTYGPRDKFENDNRVIPMMIKRIIQGKPIEIWGDGSQERSFIYVKDLVWGCLAMTNSGENYCMNIATKEAISVNHLVLTISKLLGRSTNVNYFPSKPAGPSRRMLDVTRFNSVIDFDLKDVECGLEETIEWFKKNYKH